MQKLRRVRVIGDAGFAANLHVEKGHYRRKRSRPARIAALHFCENLEYSRAHGGRESLRAVIENRA